MPRKLTDLAVEEIRAKAAAGADHAVIAREFDVTTRHVHRLVRMDQRKTTPAVDGPVGAAVRRLLDGLELDDADLVLAAAVETLAAKLDAVRVSDSAAAAAATPGLVRQLADTLRDLRGERDDVLEQVRL